MSTKAAPLSAVHVDALVGRLRAHAEAHEYIANADPEQRQWMEDLYDAANEIERLRKDAAWYRWLREFGCWLDPNKYAKAGRVLDAAIDKHLTPNG